MASKHQCDWPKSTLGDDVVIKGRIGWKGYKREDLIDFGPVVIGGTNVKSNFHLDLSEVKHLSRGKYDESPEIVLKTGDVLIVQRGNGIASKNVIPDEFFEKGKVKRVNGEIQRVKSKVKMVNNKKDTSPFNPYTSHFPSEFTYSEELGWIPMGWEVKPLDVIVHYQNGLALQKFRPDNEKYFLPVVKIAQLRAGEATSEEKDSPDIDPKCIIDNGDVVFSWSGTLMVDIWCGGQAALNQHLFKVTSPDYSKWFYYYWTKYHLAQFQRIASDKAVTMGHIKRSHLKEAFCAVPNIDLTLFDNVEQLVAKQIDTRLNNTTLANLRDTLLPKLLSGKLRIPDEEKL